MEGRRDQFIAEIVACEGVNAKKASQQVDAAIDLWVWYAGWCDKYTSIAGSQNPIAGPFYNFTTPEPLGVVGAIADQKSSLIGLVHAIAPIIASGNCAVVIANEKAPLSTITLGEVFATSDLHAGVVNLLTGKISELSPWLAAHMDIDGIDLSGASAKNITELKTLATDNLKRCYNFTGESLERILAFTESKTVWHPIGV
jgi:acyl-CoA reductase-like NAD-dependent aldehyde dehydrogenase